MPIRVALVLLGLFLVCVAIVVVAWAVGSDFYLFWPSRRSVLRDPYDPRYHPVVVLALLAFCAGVFLLYSQHYGLLLFTIILVGGVLVGAAFAFFLFDRPPTLSQCLLAVAMSAESIYGWTIHDEYLDY